MSSSCCAHLQKETPSPHTNDLTTFAASPAGVQAPASGSAPSGTGTGNDSPSREELDDLKAAVRLLRKQLEESERAKVSSAEMSTHTLLRLWNL